MTSLKLNEYDQQVEMSSVPTSSDKERLGSEENFAEQQHAAAERTDIFTLARAISYRANARKRFSHVSAI